MRHLLLSLFAFSLLTFLHCTPQRVLSDTTPSPKGQYDAFVQQLNDDYRNPDKSPLGSEGAATFKGHDFYPFDAAYRVKAQFTALEDAPFFEMKTTTSRLPKYRVYGYLKFQINGVDEQLTVYQSLDLMRNPAYRDYLFLPFTDDTNGETTYGGGRYLDLQKWEGDTVIIDFNRAYNPYCAYSDQFSCPIVPRENYLSTRIEAGIQYTETAH